MKKRIILTITLFCSILLSSCGSKNAVKGKSFTFTSISTTFDGCTEEEFFKNSYVSVFANKQEYEQRLQSTFLSNSQKPTFNGKLNIGSTATSNKTVFGDKTLEVYQVNYESISEFEAATLCLFGVDPYNSNQYHFYNHGTIDGDGTLYVNLFEPISAKGIHNFYTYKFITADKATTYSGSTLVINLSTIFEVYEGSDTLVSRKANSVMVFTLG